MPIKKISITGGPCAGKTTVTRALVKKYPHDILIVPESPTILLEGGFHQAGTQVGFSPLWLDNFQSAYLAVQRSMEHIYEEIAQKNGAQLLVCDRGMLDGAGYVSGGLEAFVKSYSLNLEEIYKRYDMVIHLESVATCNPKLFSTEGNAARYEDLATAQLRELALREAWKGHRNWIFISGKDGIEDVVNQVTKLVEPYINANKKTTA